MEPVATHAPGTFCWIELATTDPEAAKAFYTGLFGWNALDTEAGPGVTYTFLRRGEQNVGALYAQEATQREQGIPPHWFSYVSTGDADAAAERAAALGGTVVVAPFDVMDAGRMAIVQDPTGAPFGLWQTRTHPGVDVLQEPGSLCWSELATRDAEAAGAFYTGLFGWERQTGDTPGGPYTMFSRSADDPAAGMLQMTEEWGEIPSHWMPYFGVEDCDAAVARAQELGGTVKVEPITMPGVGRFAVVADPQGAVFSIITFEHFGA
ncbi:MAG: VOC family protein [Rhodothermales bacterium]|nr:VOC family protein [Rhodothermales bacterium]